MKKGFTLIELLAVIVILAIIAVIAVPIVLNIIKESKNNAALRSADFYLDAVEFSVANSTLNNQKISDGEYDIISDGNICLGTLTNGVCIGIDNRENDENDILKVEVNGEVPKSGTITIENGNIKKVDFNISEKRIIKTEGSKIMYYPEASTSINIADGSYDIKDGKICLDLACTKTQKLETNGVSPEGGWIAVEEGIVVWYDLEVDGNNYPMKPYTEDACFEYIDYYNPTQNLNEYYEIVDYDACLNLVGEGMEQFCNSAHDIITANLSGYNWLTDYVLPRGIIKQIKEFPKDTVHGLCEKEEIIVPPGIKSIDNVDAPSSLTKIILSNTVETYYTWASSIQKIILPNSLKNITLEQNEIEKVIIPSSVENLTISDYTYKLTNVTIKNKKENVNVIIPYQQGAWKPGSECQNWTGNVKDNPCIHWEQ